MCGDTVTSLPSRNKFFAIEVKAYQTADIKFPGLVLDLLDFHVFAKYFDQDCSFGHSLSNLIMKFELTICRSINLNFLSFITSSTQEHFIYFSWIVDSPNSYIGTPYSKSYWFFFFQSSLSGLCSFADILVSINKSSYPSLTISSQAY